MSVRSLRYNTIEQQFTKSAMASTDRDALAFLEAAQIYNTNQQRAIVNLVRSLKRVGLWSKMKAIYPFVGGTASSHKFNLKDPRDADAAFRLTFSGGWTHSSTGADPNGTNGYADTYWLPSVQGSQNSMHISYYSRQNATAVEVEMGSSKASSGSVDRAFIEANTAGITYAGVNGTAPNDFVQFADTDAKAYYIANRTASNVQNVFRNTAKGGTNTKASTGLPTLNIVIGAQLINTGASNFTTKECAFATIGDGLTDEDATNLYNIVDLYQKRLGRAV